MHKKELPIASECAQERRGEREAYLADSQKSARFKKDASRGTFSRRERGSRPSESEGDRRMLNGEKKS